MEVMKNGPKTSQNICFANELRFIANELGIFAKEISFFANELSLFANGDPAYAGQ
jgi:UDP-N-acetyl-D-mannosaminuronate dehydrogenase